MIIKKILAYFNHQESKKFLHDYYREELSKACVDESLALDYWNDVHLREGSDPMIEHRLMENYFMKKWLREDLEKKAKQYD